MFGRDDNSSQTIGQTDQPFTTAPVQNIQDDLATGLADESANSAPAVATPQVQNTPIATSDPSAVATNMPSIQASPSLPNDPVSGSIAASNSPIDTSNLDLSLDSMPSAIPSATPAITMPTNSIDSFNNAASIAAATTDSTNLLDIKQQVLAQLSPIVSKLDQLPEEKFKTTMMMIQATDNQALIKDAYNTALLITDEKTKAQALLDVINEINYFTQQAQQQT